MLSSIRGAGLVVQGRSPAASKQEDEDGNDDTRIRKKQAAPLSAQRSTPATQNQSNVKALEFTSLMLYDRW
jgi:hypothetical protein